MGPILRYPKICHVVIPSLHSFYMPRKSGYLNNRHMFTLLKGSTALVQWFESWHTGEVVVSSNPHADVVPTTIVYPTLVGGLNDLVVWVPKKALGGDDMSIVSQAHRKGQQRQIHYPLSGGHWISDQNKQTLYSRRPPSGTGVLLVVVNYV